MTDADGNTTGYWVDRYGYVEEADAEGVELSWERVKCEVVDPGPVGASSREAFAIDAEVPGGCK